MTICHKEVAMFKENGRAGRPEKKETSSTKGKTFNCPKCQAARTLSNIEFGEAVYCLSCDTKMDEEV